MNISSHVPTGTPRTLRFFVHDGTLLFFSLSLSLSPSRPPPPQLLSRLLPSIRRGRAESARVSDHVLPGANLNLKRNKSVAGISPILASRLPRLLETP